MKFGRGRQRNGHAAFCVAEKFEVPFFDEPEVNYLTRYRLVETPWFGIYLHRFDRPDSRPTLHDHPWSFLSIILRGGYVERRLDRKTMQVDEHHVVRRVNWARLGMTHSIRRLLRTPTWSLVFVGPRVSTWGYWRQVWNNFEDYGGTPVPGRWFWNEFDKDPHSKEFEAALAVRKAAAR